MVTRPYGYDHLPALTVTGPAIVYDGKPFRGVDLLEGDAVTQDSSTGIDRQDTATVLTVQAGLLSGITFGSSVTVNGVEYTVRLVSLIDDGALEEIILVETDA